MINMAGASRETDKKDYSGVFLLNVQRSNGTCPKKKFKERLKPLRLCFSWGSLCPHNHQGPRVTETLSGSLGGFANCSQGWKEQTSFPPGGAGAKVSLGISVTDPK